MNKFLHVKHFQAQGFEHPALHSKLILTEKPHWIDSQPIDLREGGTLDCHFKFQHVEDEIPCTLCEIDKGLVVHLKHTCRAVTPGQYAVFYSGTECLGSAKIICAPSEFILRLGQRSKTKESDLDCKLVN